MLRLSKRSVSTLLRSGDRSFRVAAAAAGTSISRSSPPTTVSSSLPLHFADLLLRFSESESPICLPYDHVIGSHYQIWLLANWITHSVITYFVLVLLLGFEER